MGRREISAGCVVYRNTGDTPEVALIQPKDRQAWALPKGLIEKGETPERAAQREAREETGLSGDIVAKIDTIQYSYNARWEDPPTRIFKIVTFYLLRFTDGDLSPVEAVKSYHATLEKLGIPAKRSLKDDLALTSAELSYAR